MKTAIFNNTLVCLWGKRLNRLPQLPGDLLALLTLK
jgi:hypothetical protein